MWPGILKLALVVAVYCLHSTNGKGKNLFDRVNYKGRGGINSLSVNSCSLTFYLYL